MVPPGPCALKGVVLPEPSGRGGVLPRLCPPAMTRQGVGSRSAGKASSRLRAVVISLTKASVSAAFRKP